MTGLPAGYRYGHPFDVFPYIAPLFGWRMWAVLDGTWTTRSGTTINARNHLTGPYFPLGRARSLADHLTSPTFTRDALWSTATATATHCGRGCPQSPGPCGTCGLYFVPRADHILRFHEVIRYARESGLDMGLHDPPPGVRRHTVLGKVRVDGLVCTAPRKHKHELPELRAHSLTIAELWVPQDAAHLVTPLSDRYRVPVHVGLDIETLTQGEGLAETVLAAMRRDIEASRAPLFDQLSPEALTRMRRNTDLHKRLRALATPTTSHPARVSE
ncbi:hypothetical protein [Nocardia sp. NPDC020380]|uniref:hypothetical protein n=1 Tax=Nocardia sp. NPDC020380 TaxID=3364309 RepID=UPI00378C5FEE